MSWSTFLADLRRAWRGVARSPGFTALAAGLLSIGIGATTAIFSVVDAVLIEPLPFRDPGRLVFVWSDMTAAGYPRGPLSGPELKDLRERTTRFDGFAAVWATSATMTDVGDPEMLRIGMVTADFFPLLGVDPGHGRLPGQDETAVLISDRLWRTRLGGDSAIVGKNLTLDGTPLLVAGVMPAGFKLLLPLNAGVPDELDAWRLFGRNLVNGERGRMYLRVVGRLRRDASLAAGAAEVSQLATSLSAEYADYGRAGRRFATVGLKTEGIRPLRGALLALLAGATLVLLTTVVNVAGLTIAKTAARAQVVAIAVALGASRARLFSQYLAEGVVLAGLGGLGSVVLSLGGIRLLRAVRPEPLSRLDEAAANPVVMGLATLIVLGAALIVSLAPLLESRRLDIASTLRRRTGAVQQRLRTRLVAAQLACTVVLVVAAALFARSFRAVQVVDPGFVAHDVTTFRIALPPDRAFDQTAFNVFSRALTEKLTALPGVFAVGAVSHLPFDNVPNWSTTWMLAPGGDDSEARRADARAVSPGYFRTVGARLVAGRDFTEADDGRAQPVVIIDESLARQAWPNADPIGKVVFLDPFVTGHATNPATVIGMVRHIRHLSLLAEVREQAYFPARQIPRNPMTYLLRTSPSTTGLATMLRATVNELDPSVPVANLRPLTDAVAGARGTQRFVMQLVTSFALVGLGIATIGVYGLLTYLVAKRRSEFGIRLALGAVPGSIVRLVFRDTARLILPGLVIGVVVALLAAQAIRQQLYGVRPTDPLSYLAVVPAVAVVALVAGWIPARGAARVNPSDALRAE